jgi:putative phosphoribosyl transferase
VVAAPVARQLALPLDVLVIRKLGLPFSPEVAFGAVGPGGVEIRDGRLTGMIGQIVAGQIANRARVEVRRREDLYRGDRPALELTGKVSLLIDDGLATGSTAQAAVAVARSLHARHVVVVAPVGAPEAVDAIAAVADEVVCPLVPSEFTSVSQWYDEFDQVSDSQVVSFLNG